MHPWKQYRLRPEKKVRLARWESSERTDDAQTDKKAKATLARNLPKLERLQGVLYAGKKHRLLLVLQGMDTAGKDATIRRVFEGVNPQGVRVARFGPPTDEEHAHDFLWRVHPHVPAAGEIVVFNRSHYEDVLWPRVHREITDDEVQRRFGEIRDFERLLVANGTSILKFFLHLGRAEQQRRLEARLSDPTKHWKFSVHDLAERPLWPKYVRAYEDLLGATSTEEAPWFVVPSDHPLSRDVVVAQVVVRLLERLGMTWPPLDPAVRRQLSRGELAALPHTARSDAG